MWYDGPSEEGNSVKRSIYLTCLFVVLCMTGLGGAARADTVPPNARAEVMYLAQLGQAGQSAAQQKTQATCYSVCSKQCDADYRTCTVNGKAPQLVVTSTCSPRLSECTTKCNASCYK